MFGDGKGGGLMASMLGVDVGAISQVLPEVTTKLEAAAARMERIEGYLERIALAMEARSPGAQVENDHDGHTDGPTDLAGVSDALAGLAAADGAAAALAAGGTLDPRHG